jgi:hypothetical protein
MRLFEFQPDVNTTREVTSVDVATEATLETWLHANPELILDEPLLIFGRQYGLATGIPDLLALDQWGNVVVVELKKGRSGSGSASEETILSQPQTYASDLSTLGSNELEEIYAEYTDRIQSDEWDIGDAGVVADSLVEAHGQVFGGDVDPSELNRVQRMVILAEDITGRTENNARYLLEQGLAVQCVEVQWFRSATEAGDDAAQSFLVSTTVVDYPLSRVRPAQSSTDFSALTGQLSDLLRQRISDTAGIESVRATPTKVIVDSAVPTGLRYEVYLPGEDAGRKAQLRVNAEHVEDAELEQLQELLHDAASGLSGYVVNDSGVLNVLHREEPVRVNDRDNEAIESAVAEVEGLINDVQPLLLNEFGQGE